MEKFVIKTGTGMILGKFMPPHLGHQYLVDFARNYVDGLTVIVGTLASEPIPGELRHRWMREMFPDVNVYHLTDDNPQYPHEHPDFWRIWHDSIRKAIPVGPDYVFASEDYGWKLAEVLGAKYVPVDHLRELVPVSGSDIREDPMNNWRYIPTCVRPYFARRVCIFGPESTGKSILAKRLAERFDTVYAAEYARGMLALQDDKVFYDDIPRIARGQMASEDSMVKQANRVIFLDTDLITTTIWSDVLFGDCPQWIKDEAERRRYDLYLLMDVDTPWVDDPQRFAPDNREEFLGRFERELASRGRPYVKISGSWDERLERAEIAVDALLERPRISESHPTRI
ncbi:MAG: AAA family ATPase [Nitrospinae bacterium]|nr:AAA family ATPase [Nitrospinota bacterium]